jgi:hypothetical protein
MLYENQSQLSARRQGVILLVVISLLTLFAIVGISFVLYANAAANASKVFRDSASQTQPDMDPEMLLSFFMGKLLYDEDDVNGIYSAMRGQSLGRGIYGLNYNTGPNGNMLLENFALPTSTSVSPGTPLGPLNGTPFNGTGRLHTSGTSAMNPWADDYLLPNHTYYPADKFIRYAERFTGGPVGTGGALYPPLPPAASFIFTGGANAPYTYPDLNNMFLAAVKADGSVMTQSFHRQWLFNSNLGTTNPTQQLISPATGQPYLLNDPSNPNWGDAVRFPPPLGYPSAAGKYLLLRPRPIDQLLANENFPPNRPYFDYPEDPGGDIKNLPGPGYLVGINPTTGQPIYANNDSVWIDLNAPIMVAPDGTKYKALFAAAIMDLDGRVNLNITGNVRGNNGLFPMPLSNQGWGPWEVNHWNLITPNDPQTLAKQKELDQLFLGNGTVTGRYGADGVPTSQGNIAPGGTVPHFYGQVDYDASNPDGVGGGYTAALVLPGTLPVPPTSSFPGFPPGYGNGSNLERLVHPLLSNYFSPQGDDRIFPVSNMEALLRYGDTNSPSLTSDLFRLCPTSFGDPLMPALATRMRNLVTTLSFDVDQPGLSPWAIPPTATGVGQANYGVPPAAGQFPQPPRCSSAAPFPPLSQITRNQSSGEFGLIDWRAANAALGRINLNRFLTPYQTFDPTLGWLPLNQNQVAQATVDRQQMAADIFIRLVIVTGAYDFINDPVIPPPPPGQPSQFDALRWLAQLSANIVDYIDGDDVMTPFPWALASFQNGPNLAYQNYMSNQQNVAGISNQQIMAGIQAFQNAAVPPIGTMDQIGQGWVFGTELPRVVINEAYAEYTVVTPPTATNQKFTLNIDVWAELNNRFNPDFQGADPPLNNPPGSANLSAYQLLLANAVGSLAPPVTAINSAYLRQGGNTSNVSGQVPPTSLYSTPPPKPGTPGNPCQVPLAGNTIQPNGGATPPFLVVGSQSTKPNIPMNPPPYPGGALPSPLMTYQTTVPGTAGQTKPTNPPPTPTIVLQRLANPFLPPSTTPGLLYNPYITVDYFEGADPSVVAPTLPNPKVLWQVQDSNNDTKNPNPNMSFGRSEPYAGYAGYVGQSFVQPQAAPPSNKPMNTFYQVNQPVGLPGVPPPGQPFHWLTHMDRQLISPMELLQVSAYKPHELTQQFVTWSAATSFQYNQHRAYWFDEELAAASITNQSHLLYRLFEFLETGNRAAGMTPGGRIPGKINLNTIYDQQEVFAAACAALQPNPNPSYFDSNNVSTIFLQMLNVRSPGLVTAPLGAGDGTLHPPANSNILPAPGQQNDQPIMSLAAAFSTGLSAMPQDQQYPAGSGINSTLLEKSPSGPLPRLFQVTSFGTPPQQVSHPYLQDQLLTKIFNNLTTRSNTFAVFLTVGFFQVYDTDPTTGQTLRPVKLGAEIGKAENRHIRHRMFAIVDRTNMATEKYNPNTIQPPPVYVAGITPFPQPPPFPPPPGTPSAYATVAIPNCQVNGPAGMPPTSLSGSYEGMPWIINSGSNILIDTGINQELVNVLGINGGNPPSIVVQVNSAAGPGTNKPHSGTVAITPVNTITASTPAAIAKNSPPVPVTFSQQSGVFQGASWSLQIGTYFLLWDVVNPPEVVQIVQLPGQNGPFIQAANASGQFQYPHQAQFTANYPIPVGGNPGPQANFDMRQVPWVIRHFSIIN